MGDQLILGAHDRFTAARVALPAAAAEELPVDAPRIVALGADDVQAAELDDAGPELDVSAAPGHVGRDRDAPALACLGDDFGFVGVLPRVEQPVAEPRLV